MIATIISSIFTFIRYEDLHFLQGDIFGAGMDTTATTLKFVVLYLCKYPQWQERLRQETNTASSDSFGSALLRAFITEVQRLHPAVPLGVPHANKVTILFIEIRSNYLNS